LKHGHSPVEISDAGKAYGQGGLVSANIIYLMVVGNLRFVTFERSVGLGDILEFLFAIPVFVTSG